MDLLLSAPPPVADSPSASSMFHLLRMIFFLGGVLLAIYAGHVALRLLRNKYQMQGYAPLRRSSERPARGAGSELVVSHRPGAASGQRLVHSLQTQESWTVRTPSGSSVADVTPSTRVMLVVVDGSWPLSSAGIEAAYAAGVTIWPVLVDDATMPKMSELPNSLAFFPQLQAQTVHGDSWDDDVASLSKKLASA